MSRRGTSYRRVEAPAALRLRELLDSPEILELPTVCEPLGARVAADSGFGAVTLPGYAIGAHLSGGELVTIARIEAALRRVEQACHLPVLLDADAGWDDEGDVTTAVRRFVDAGAAAIQLNSQHLPAAVPFDGEVERAGSHAELVDRVRNAAGLGAVITARIDLDADDAYGTILSRAAELVDAGAGAVLVQSTSDATLRAIARDLPESQLIYAPAPALPCLPAVYPIERLQDWGFAGVANKYHACHCPRTNPVASLALPEAHSASQG